MIEDQYGVEVGQKYERVSWYARSAFNVGRVGDVIEIEEIVTYTLDAHNRIKHARIKYLSGNQEGDGDQVACRAIKDNWRLVTHD